MQLPVGLKKIAGILIIVVFVIVELLLLVTLFVVISDGNDRMLQTALESVFTMAMMAFPIWYGLRLWKSSAAAPTIPPVAQVPVTAPSIPSDAIKIETKLDLPEYRKLIFRLTYTNPVIIWGHLIGLMFVSALLTNPQAQHWFFIVIVVLLLLMPISVFRAANANYKSAKALHEAVTYAFTPENITLYGESFQTTIQWRSLYKIREVGQWLLIYENKQVAMFIAKSSFASAAELEAVKQMASNHNIKKHWP